MGKRPMNIIVEKYLQKELHHPFQGRYATRLEVRIATKSES